VETNPGFSMSVDGQSATPRRFLLDEFRAMRGRDDLGNPVPWALRAARAGEGTGAGTKHGFFPPLTLMPCDSGRDNQLRVKSPPMIVIIN